jgi:hypothetical protein
MVHKLAVGIPHLIDIGAQRSDLANECLELIPTERIPYTPRLKRGSGFASNLPHDVNQREKPLSIWTCFGLVYIDRNLRRSENILSYRGMNEVRSHWSDEKFLATDSDERKADVYRSA